MRRWVLHTRKLLVYVRRKDCVQREIHQCVGTIKLSKFTMREVSCTPWGCDVSRRSRGLWGARGRALSGTGPCLAGRPCYDDVNGEGGEAKLVNGTYGSEVHYWK